MTQVKGEWQNFGPDIQITGLYIDNNSVEVSAEQITFSFDVWRSLLHFQLYFRELTFEQLAVNYKNLFLLGKMVILPSLNPMISLPFS